MYCVQTSDSVFSRMLQVMKSDEWCVLLIKSGRNMSEK